jgi:molecular chaperone GrpE
MSENDDSTNSGIEEPQDPAKLSEAINKAKNDYLYLLAEFDNYRKNAVKERSELIKYGSERFVRDFLGILDSFELALGTGVPQANIDAFREGVKMIATEMRSLLQKHGVEEVKAEGKPFDPTQHEALSSEPREDMPAGHVANVFKKAYKMHDKLIRPAQVTVSTVKT